jgi:alkylation response protein AidB-like acyl-CoA dehydrogenase
MLAGHHASPDELVSLCRVLAQRFAPRAAEHDRTGAFPTVNFQDIKDAGLLGMLVPATHGGFGADFLTYTRAIEQLAIGDASTALAFNMHNIVMGCLSSVDPDALEGRRGQSVRRFLEWAFDEVVRGGKMFGTAGSEPEVGPRLSKIRTTYRRVEGGYVLNGVKSFVSMVGHADYCLVAARAPEEVAGVPAISYFVVERDNPGTRVEEVWDTLGMRSTCSNTMHLTDCFVPSERLFLLEGLALYKITREPQWLIAGYNGVYLGLATATFEFLTDYLRKRKIAGTAESLAADPLVQHRVGELYVAVEAARAVTYEAARLVVEAPGSDEANVAIHRAKYMVGELGPWLTSQAIRLCGGSTISKRMPLERFYRDSRCGGLMAARSDDCLTYVGKAMLGIDVKSPLSSYW